MPIAVANLRHAKQHFEILQGLTDIARSLSSYLAACTFNFMPVSSADAAIALSIRNITNPSDPVSDQSVIVLHSMRPGKVVSGQIPPPPKKTL